MLGGQSHPDFVPAQHSAMSDQRQHDTWQVYLSLMTRVPSAEMQRRPSQALAAAYCSLAQSRYTIAWRIR